MKIYQVGGAVRDKLLGIQPKEVDWVVTGATPDMLLSKGFKQVGKDFPVFLHPDTKEEYALARTEKKVNKGYHGFVCFSDPKVSLDQDLMRRDLTINAIAEDADGTLIDPFEGQKDIDKKILRHVSEAFVEDPLRVLRIARFAARLPAFKVADSTQLLLEKMVAADMLAELVPERVWKELSRALTEPAPECFFMVLNDCGANQKLWPELIDQIPMFAEFSKRVCNDLERFAVLFWGQSTDIVKSFSQKWKVPRMYQALAMMTAMGASSVESGLSSAEALVDLLQQLDVRRKETLARHWVNMVAFRHSKDMADWLNEAIRLYVNIDEANVVKQCEKPAMIQGALRNKRIEVLAKLFSK